jgi:hypothetical protein
LSIIAETPAGREMLRQECCNCNPEFDSKHKEQAKQFNPMVDTIPTVVECEDEDQLQKHKLNNRIQP